MKRRAEFSGGSALIAPISDAMAKEAAAVSELTKKTNDNPGDLALAAEWERREKAFLADVEALPCEPHFAWTKARAIALLWEFDPGAEPKPTDTADQRLMRQLVTCVLARKDEEPADPMAEWLDVIESHAANPRPDLSGLLGAILHARRLGLTRDDLAGVTVREPRFTPSPDEHVLLQFYAEDRFQCTVSAATCHLSWTAPGAVELDRLGNPRFDHGGGQ